MNKKAIIAMSGGVDSSVSALLMLEKGYECMGMTMSLFDTNELGLPERSHDDVADAKAVCDRLGIQHIACDFKQEFKCHVISRFVSAYEKGRTPNPCIDCNRNLKFGKMIDEAQRLGYDYIATGHYARIVYDEEKGRYLLRKAADPAKDQSYVLYNMTQHQLSHTIFPLGELTKPEVREIAEKNNFVNAHKGDSQDICFIPDGDYASFIEKRRGRKFPPGNFIDESGKVLGRHKGIIHYTVGQRKGLGLALPQPMYVKAIDVKANTVILTTNSGLFTTKVVAKSINLIDCDRITKPRRVKARIRYHQQEQWATVIQTDDDTLELEFDEPQRAITKGQSLVMYEDDFVVGGGVIC